MNVDSTAVRQSADAFLAKLAAAPPEVIARLSAIDPELAAVVAEWRAAKQEAFRCDRALHRSVARFRVVRARCTRWRPDFLKRAHSNRRQVLNRGCRARARRSRIVRTAATKSTADPEDARQLATRTIGGAS